MDRRERKQEDRERILYKNNGTNCYMVIMGGEEPRLPYQVNTIRYNKIEGLLPVHFLIENGEYQYFYDITCKEPLFDQMKNRKYTVKEIRTILSDLYRCIHVMEEYLLDINLLLVEPEYIFFDKKKHAYCFCFYPEKKGTFETAFRGLLEYFMNFLDYQDESTVVLVFSMYQKARNRNTSFAEIMQEFCEIKEPVKTSEKLPEKQDDFYEIEKDPEAPDGYDMEKTGDKWKLFGFRQDRFGQYEFRQERTRENGIGEKSRSLCMLIPYIPDLAGGYAAARILIYLKNQYGVLSIGQKGLCIAAVIAIAGICGCISVYLVSVMKKKTECETVKTLENRIPFRREENASVSEKINPDKTASKKIELNKIAPKKIDPDQIALKKMKSDKIEQDPYLYEFEEYSFQGKESCGGFGTMDEKQVEYGKRYQVRDGDRDQDRDRIPVREWIPATVVMRCSGSIVSGFPVLVSCNRARSHDIVLDKDELLIGKIQGVVDIYMNGQNVSRIHAKVFRNQEGYGIVDMGSTNGTYVNGEQITERKRVFLKEGDEVQLADLKFVFRTGFQEDPADCVQANLFAENRSQQETDAL